MLSRSRLLAGGAIYQWDAPKDGFDVVSQPAGYLR